MAIVVRGKGPTGFDTAQNMMLAAWGDRDRLLPNGIANPEALATMLGHDDDEQVVTVLSFGYPARPANPERRTPDEWIERADQHFDDVVEIRS